MSECICEGNWRTIISESEDYFCREYEDSKGKIFKFDGVIWCFDDFYYLMIEKGGGEHRQLSCVGSIDGHGYTLIEKDDIGENIGD